MTSLTQQAAPAVTTPPASGPQQTDGRTAELPLALRLLARPEMGVFLGALAVLGVLPGGVYAAWNPDWFKAFLGVMLLGATLIKLWVSRATRR